MQIHRNSGFTMLEVLITVAVLSILVALAVPSFREMMDRNAVTSATNDLLSSVLLARSEAIKREARIVFAKKGANWKKWRVFVDANKDGTFSSGEEVLQEGEISNPALSISDNGSLSSGVIFTSRGRALNALTASADYLQITAGGATRYLCFNPAGRPRIPEKGQTCQ